MASEILISSKSSSRKFASLISVPSISSDIPWCWSTRLALQHCKHKYNMESYRLALAETCPNAGHTLQWAFEQWLHPKYWWAYPYSNPTRLIGKIVSIQQDRLEIAQELWRKGSAQFAGQILRASAFSLPFIAPIQMMIQPIYQHTPL